MALSLCSQAGCSALVPKGRCPAHPKVKTWDRPAWQHSVASRHKRGMGSDHDAMRKGVLAEEPVCRECGSPDNPTLDRIIPASEGGTLDRENCQRLCRDCQQRKASREGRRARAGV